jgi:hypothetical protein
MGARLTKRVASGAAWLDTHRPGWRAEVSVETLDMNSPFSCVLGQVARAIEPERGSFGSIVDCADAGAHAACIEALRLAAPLTQDEATEMGFEVSGEETYAALDQAWRRVLLDAGVPA